MFGGRLGLLYKLSHGHGDLRGEFRFDYLTEGEDKGEVIIPKGLSMGMKLGFDLWL